MQIYDRIKQNQIETSTSGPVSNSILNKTLGLPTVYLRLIDFLSKLILNK
jgi:hypothetical protein